MRLVDQLESISTSDVGAEIGKMLDHAHVSVSSYGQRLVSIDGYDGSVEINELALAYFKAEAFERYEDACFNKQFRCYQLYERIRCYELWGRIQELYEDSDDELNKTWLLKYLTPAKETLKGTINMHLCRLCAGDPMAIIGEWAHQGGDHRFSEIRRSLIEFTPDEFKEIWPKGSPKYIVNSGENSERWIPSPTKISRIVNKIGYVSWENLCNGQKLE